MKIVAQEKVFLEQIPLYVVGGGDVNGLAVESVNVCSERIIGSLDDRFEGRFGLRVTPRSGKAAAKLDLQISPRNDGFGGKAFVLVHSSIPQSRGE